MLAMNKNVAVNAKCMERTGSKLVKIGILLSVGILLEFASFVSFTEAIQLKFAPDSLSDNAYDNVKRAGFVGMRGKKSDMDDVNPLTQLMWNPSWPNLNKRAGFVGMRGKKSYDFENKNNLLRYLTMLYHQQPLKRYTPFQYASSTQRHGGELKRAGFVGMRGKKSDPEAATSDEVTLQKKAAFVGMRGRRTPSELQYDERFLPYIQDFDSSLLDDDEMLSQKERRAGFVGMRG